MYLFPSDEWIKAMMKDLNQSQAYKEAAKNWEGVFILSLSRQERLPKPLSFTWTCGMESAGMRIKLIIWMK